MYKSSKTDTPLIIIIGKSQHTRSPSLLHARECIHRINKQYVHALGIAPCGCCKPCPHGQGEAREVRVSAVVLAS